MGGTSLPSDGCRRTDPASTAGLQVEAARASDGDSIMTISRRFPGFVDMDLACIQELWDEYVQDGPDESGYHFLLARGPARAQRSEQAVLGFACYGPTPLTVGVFDLYWLAVDPGARRRGVGRALLTRVEQETRARGGRMLLIETSGSQAYEEARRFYEACAYHYQAVIHDFYAEGEDLLVFRKRLR